MDPQLIVETVKETWSISTTFKLTTSSIKKSLQYILKTVDVEKLLRGDYSYDSLINICKNSIIRYAVIGAILKLYSTNQESLTFIDKVEYNINKIQEIRSIIKSGKLPFINTTSTECINLIYDLINDPVTLRMDPRTLFETLYKIYRPQESYVSLKSLVTYTCHFLKDKDKDLSELLYNKYTEYNHGYKLSADKIFEKESNWKAGLIKHLREINTDRLAKTSAYPELTLRKILSNNVMILRHFETYLKEQIQSFPLNIDSLHWFFSTTDISGLKKAIIFIANNYVHPDNDRVKSKHAKHHCYDFIKNIIVFFRDRIPMYLTCKKDLHSLDTNQLLGKINDLREIPIEKVRRHFYDDEMTKIMEEIRDDSKYTLIFTILKEVGLRIGAVCTLRCKHFINHKGEYLDTCRKLEKGKKFRTFPISNNLREKVQSYLTDNPDIKKNIEGYLFPSKGGNYLSPDAVRDKLCRITEKLDIYGHHVHPHAFRHTIVNNLMAQGNKLENVSKFMGHSNISTTEQYYWTTELENIIPTMNIPWLNQDDNNHNDTISTPPLTREDDLSIDLLVSIIAVYHSVVTNEQKVTIQERIPNIEKIFANICEYSMTTSVMSD